MASWLKRFKFSMRSDRAENSIMQTITVAVSAILIAAGTLTAPGLINGQKENNLRTELGDMAFAQTAWVAAKGSVNQNFIPSNGGSDNLARWKYPYDFDKTAFKENPTVQWCYKNEYVVKATTKTGKQYAITSSKPEAVPISQLVLPTTCKPGYVPPADVTPSVPDKITAPTAIAKNLAFYNGIQNLTWTGVACTTNVTTPAYQIRVKFGTNTTLVTNAWSSATNQSLDFLDDNNTVSNTKTTYYVASKCRSNDTGDLSDKETVSTQVLTYTAP
jgi:hypothetical protein